MAQNPALNLDQAMYHAHHSFGVLGFRPIIKSMEGKLRKKYALAYFKTYTNFKIYPIVAVIAYMGYVLYQYFEAKQINMVYDNDVWLIAFLTYIISDLSLIFRFKASFFNKGNYYARFVFRPAFFLVFVLILPSSSAAIAEKLQIGGLYAALQLAFITIHTIAKYKSLKAAQDDNKSFLYRKEEL